MPLAIEKNRTQTGCTLILLSGISANAAWLYVIQQPKIGGAAKGGSNANVNRVVA